MHSIAKGATAVVAVVSALMVLSLSDLNPLLLWEPWRNFLNSLPPRLIIGAIVGLPLVAIQAAQFALRPQRARI